MNLKDEYEKSLHKPLIDDKTVNELVIKERKRLLNEELLNQKAEYNDFWSIFEAKKDEAESETESETDDTADVEDTEEVDPDQPKHIKILFMTSSKNSKNEEVKGKNPTVKKMEKYCNENGIEFYTVFADIAAINKDKRGNITISNYDDDGIKIDNDNTFVIARRGVMFHKYSLNLISRLEKMRFCFLNDRQSLEVCEDKYLTTLKLAESGVPVPKTVIVPNDKAIDKAFKKLGGKFPIIAKTLTGTQGIGVFMVDNMITLKSVLQAMWSIGGGTTEILLQEFIETDHDVRVHILDGEVMAAMRRNKVDGDFRTNVHLGATTDKYEVSEEIADIAIKAAKVVGCRWAGVDIIFDKQGNPYVLEVNSSPGTDGIEKISGVNVTEKVMEYCKNIKKWRKTAQEVGIFETVELEGIGKVIAKFDTGNDAKSCSLDAHDITEKGKMVHWLTNGIEMKARKVATSKIKVNGDSEENAQERVVVKLDVIFDGVIYKDVKFNLTDRSHKASPVLVCRDFMKASGSIVNPTRKFAVTNKPKDSK